MKNLQMIIYLIALLFFSACGKDAPEPKEPQTGPQEQTSPQEDPKNQSVILAINGTGYTNQHLKDFIKGRYTDTTVIENNSRVASRIFDAFIEHQMVLYTVQKENIQLEQSELETYLKDKQLPPNRINNEAVINSVKVQKYLYFKLYKDIDVTDAEIRSYYERHLDEFRKTAEIYLHQIVVKDKTKARDIRKQVYNNPEKFAEVAKAESISSEKSSGGAMGYFSKGTLPIDMDNVVFALKIDEISPVVPSPYGYHIFKVSKKKAKRLLSLASVSSQIKNRILSDKLRWAYEDFLAQLKKQLTVEPRYQELYFEYQKVRGGEQSNETTSDENTNLETNPNTGTGSSTGN